MILSSALIIGITIINISIGAPVGHSFGPHSITQGATPALSSGASLHSSTTEAFASSRKRKGRPPIHEPTPEVMKIRGYASAAYNRKKQRIEAVRSGALDPKELGEPRVGRRLADDDVSPQIREARRLHRENMAKRRWEEREIKAGRMKPTPRQKSRGRPKNATGTHYQTVLGRHHRANIVQKLAVAKELVSRPEGELNGEQHQQQEHPDHPASTSGEGKREQKDQSSKEQGQSSDNGSTSKWSKSGLYNDARRSQF